MYVPNLVDIDSQFCTPVFAETNVLWGAWDDVNVVVAMHFRKLAWRPRSNRRI